MEDMRQQQTTRKKKIFPGITVTSFMSNFSNDLLFNSMPFSASGSVYLFNWTISCRYLFIANIKVIKPDFKVVLGIIGFGIILLFILIIKGVVLI